MQQLHLSKANLLVSVCSANQVRASLPARLYSARHLRPVRNNPLALQVKPHPYLASSNQHRQHSLLDKLLRTPKDRLAKPLQVLSALLVLRNRSHSSVSASVLQLWHSRQPPLVVFLVNPRLQMLASQNQRGFLAHQQPQCLQVV